MTELLNQYLGRSVYLNIYLFIIYLVNKEFITYLSSQSVTDSDDSLVRFLKGSIKICDFSLFPLLDAINLYVIR